MNFGGMMDLKPKKTCLLGRVFNEMANDNMLKVEL